MRAVDRRVLDARVPRVVPRVLARIVSPVDRRVAPPIAARQPAKPSTAAIAAPPWRRRFATARAPAAAQRIRIGNSTLTRLMLTTTSALCARAAASHATGSHRACSPRRPARRRLT